MGIGPGESARRNILLDDRTTASNSRRAQTVPTRLWRS
jgi:hypothetical protein